MFDDAAYNEFDDAAYTMAAVTATIALYRALGACLRNMFEH
jgi:hypothetical protein